MTKFTNKTREAYGQWRTATRASYLAWRRELDASWAEVVRTLPEPLTLIELGAGLALLGFFMKWHSATAVLGILAWFFATLAYCKATAPRRPSSDGAASPRARSDTPASPRARDAPTRDVRDE